MVCQKKDVVVIYVDDLTILHIYLENDSIEHIHTEINWINSKVNMRGFNFSSYKLIVHNENIKSNNLTKLLESIYWTTLNTKWQKIIKMWWIASITCWADHKILISLYKSLIESRLTYSCEIFSSTRKCWREALERVQQTEVRVLIGALETASETLCYFLEVKIPTTNILVLHKNQMYSITSLLWTFQWWKLINNKMHNNQTNQNKELET